MAGSDEQRDSAAGSSAGEPGPLSRLLQELADASGEDALDAWKNEVKPGDRVGRFEIQREVGRGGFGAVYEAFDTELSRVVAVKTLRLSRPRRDLSSDWIKKEAEAVARLDHPCIVTLFDVGTCDSGPYLVMELLRGKTLAQRIAEGPISQGEALRIAEEMAKGLAHAHQRGVLHRDLKPANVFVCEDGRVKLLDFGLAHLLGTEGVSGAGTPKYMAPEQARGEEVDQRADVYAAGRVLGDILGKRHPRRLERAVAQATFTDPAARPRDGTAWLELLQEAHHAVERPRLLRRAALLAAIGVVVGSILAAAFLSRVLPRGIVPGPDGRITVAVADFENQTSDPELDSMSGLLITSLEQSRHLRVLTRGRVFDALRKMGKEDVRRIDEPLAREVGRLGKVDVLLLASVRRLDGAYVVEMRALDPARDEYLFAIREQAAAKQGLLTIVDRLSETTRLRLHEVGAAVKASETRVGSSVTTSLEAYRHYLLGQQFENETLDVSAAVAEFKEALAADPEFALPHLELALLVGWHDAPDEDERSHMEAASRNVGKLPDKERRLVLGYKAFVERRHTEAIRILDALALDYPLDKQVLYVAGEAFWHGDTPGGFARAVALFRAALELDPAYNVAYIHLFEWLDRFGPKGEALARAEKAARFRPSAQAQMNVARALGASGRWEDALAAARSAASVSGGEHFETAYAQAEVLFAAGDRAEAERSLRKWLAPGVRPGQRRVAAEVLSPLLALQGRAREGREVFLAVAGESAGQQYEAFDASLLAYLALAGADQKAARRSLESHPPPPPGTNPNADRMAWLLAWLGLVEDAAARVQVLPPGSLSERQYAAVLALRERRNLDAIEILGDLSRRTPAVEPQFLLGMAFAAEGRHSEALQAFEVVRSLHGINVPASVHVFRPWADVLAAESLVQLGRRDEARVRVKEWLADWSEADPGLPLLAEARGLQARLAAAK